jgi:hypothetical protein
MISSSRASIWISFPSFGMDPSLRQLSSHLLEAGWPVPDTSTP